MRRELDVETATRAARAAARRRWLWGRPSAREGAHGGAAVVPVRTAPGCRRLATRIQQGKLRYHHHNQLPPVPLPARRTAPPSPTMAVLSPAAIVLSLPIGTRVLCALLVAGSLLALVLSQFAAPPEFHGPRMPLFYALVIVPGTSFASPWSVSVLGACAQMASVYGGEAGWLRRCSPAARKESWAKRAKSRASSQGANVAHGCRSPRVLRLQRHAHERRGVGARATQAAAPTRARRRRNRLQTAADSACTA